MLVSSKEMLLAAQKGAYAIPSPDFIDSNSARAYVRVAEEVGKPIILSFAEIHLDQMDIEEVAELGKFYAGRASVPVALHLDHGRTFSVIERALELGFTSVMLDASSEPIEENIRRTKEVVALAHSFGAFTEAEIGHVGAEDAEGAHPVSESIYTEPAEARRFELETGVDSIAVSIGTAHGKYKGTPKISFERLAELKAAVEAPLVLHGGSGSGDENLRACARGGICKVNLFTDFIVAALESVYAEKQKKWMDVLNVGSDAMMKVLRHYYEVLG